jgi:hypothetical protein
VYRFQQFDSPIRPYNKDILVHIEIFPVAATYIEANSSRREISQKGIDDRPGLMRSAHRPDIVESTAIPCSVLS